MKKALKWIIDILFVVFGTLIYAGGVYFFTEPNGIAPGGVVGIATGLNALFGFSIGLTTFIINIPLIILGVVFLGRNFIIKTLLSLSVFTISLDYIFVYFPVYTDDKIISAIFGGLLMGIGLGINYLRDGSTGGMDIINRVIIHKFPNMKMGSIVFITDTVVVLFAVLVFRDINVLLYSALAIYISAKLVDDVLYGTGERKMLMVVTDKTQAVTKKILSLQRGVTVIKATGGFSGTEKSVIICVTAKNEYYRFRRAVADEDENAFIIIANAGEVHGNGFLPL